MDLKQNKNNELNNNQKYNDEQKRSFVAVMLDALWQKIYLIIIIVIVAIVSGVIYNNVRTPDYTSFDTVIYTTKNTSATTNETVNVVDADGNDVYDENGKIKTITKTVVNEYSTTHIDFAKRYISTVSDFFKTGVVSERAEYYYAQFEAIATAKGYTDEYSRDFELGIFAETVNKTKFTMRKLIEYKNYDVLFNIENASGIVFERCKIENKDSIGTNYLTTDVQFSYTKDNEKHYLTIKNSNIEEYSITLCDYDVTDYVFVDGFLSESGIYYDVKEKDVEVRKNCLIKKNENGEFVYVCESKTFPLVKEDVELITFSDYMSNYANISFNAQDSNLQIEQGNISVSYDSDDDSFVFTIGYKDYDAMRSKEKVKIVILATNQEARRETESSKKSNSVTKEYTYFNVIEVNLNDLGFQTITPNISNKKILLFFVIGGVAVAFLVIYISSLFDKTVKTRDEIEKLMHVPLLANIEKAKEEDE